MGIGGPHQPVLGSRASYETEHCAGYKTVHFTERRLDVYVGLIRELFIVLRVAASC